MAIDSEDKRRSVLRILPIADNSISGVDKQHIVGLYRGIAAQAPAGGGSPIFSTDGVHSTIFGGMVVH
jgi:hypothetical protein